MTAVNPMNPPLSRPDIPQPRPLPWPPRPWPLPWPHGTDPSCWDPFLIAGGAGTAGERAAMPPPPFAAIASAPAEVLKRIYCRPDYQPLIRQVGVELIRQLDRDPEAAAAFKEFLGRAVEPEADERNPVVLIAAGAAVLFLGSALLGYCAETKQK